MRILTLFLVLTPFEPTAFQVYNLVSCLHEQVGGYKASSARSAIDEDGLILIELGCLMQEIVFTHIDVYGPVNMTLVKLLGCAHIK